MSRPVRNEMYQIIKDIAENVEIPPNVRKIEVSVYEGPGQKATWEEDLS